MKCKVQNEKRKVKTQSLKFLIFSFALFALSFTLINGCSNKQLYKDTELLLGTFVEVTSSDAVAAKIAFAEIRRIENLLSKYKADSEISRLNQKGELRVSPETMFVLKKAEEFWLLTDGAFDVTVGPLMDLWGFTQKKYYLPKEQEVREVLKGVGFDKIILNPKDNMIKFRLPGMRIDLGALAKGYAVDCAVKELKKKGIKDFLINAGGDIYCLGDKRGQPWKVAIEEPRRNTLLGYLELKDVAVATSGDYQQYFLKDKKRYTHIFNPKTGYPVDSSVISVTVIAPDCLTADALATSIFVLGKVKGEALAKKFTDVRVKIVEDIK